MRATGAWARAIAGAGLGMLGGCLGAAAFLCESDEVCQQGGTTGLCQPSGYCSFPDEECASGQRYGAYAGGSLAGECVEPGAFASDGGSTDDGVTTSPLTTSTATTGVTSSTTSPPTTGVDGPVTTEPVGESDSGGSTGPSTGGMNDEAPATTTGAPPQVVCWSDEFDDGTIGGEWCPGSDPGVTIDEPDGHLRFALDPTQWGMGSGSGWVSTCNWVPLLGMEAATEVLAVPQVSPHTEAYIEAGNDGVRLGMGVLGGELYAFVWDGMTYAGVSFQPYEPAAHRHLRVVGTDDGLVAESSPDGMAWAHVHTLATDLEGADGYAALGAWGELVPLGPDEATFERFELCWLEG